MVPAIEISLVIADKRHLVSQADEEAFHLYADHRGKTDLGHVAGVVVPVKHRMIPVVHEINTQIRAGTEKQAHIVRHFPRETCPQGNLEHMAHQRRLLVIRSGVILRERESPLRVIQTGFQREMRLELILYRSS